MTAKFDRTEHYNLERFFLIEVAETALEKGGFKIKEVDEMRGIIYAKSGMSFRSWSENIVVIIEDNGEVYMKSECAIPTQIMDWGKNKKNVERFFSILDEMGFESIDSDFV